MLAGVAEDLQEEFRGAVEHFGAVAEAVDAVDEAVDHHDAGDAVERAKGGLGVGEGVQHAESRGVGGLDEVDLAADLAERSDLAVLHRQGAGEVEQVARADGGDVGARGGGRGRQGDTEFGEAGFDGGHKFGTDAWAGGPLT